MRPYDKKNSAGLDNN